MNHTALVLLALLLPTVVSAQSQWRPKDGPLMTRWAADVKPDNVHPEYPRPQMVRSEWQNLNGLWEYAIRPKSEDRPAKFDGQILVPFPIESALSGVMQRVDENQRLWYRRTFDIRASWAGKRVLLHFGAVDWEATVWVNGQQLEMHRGGYDPFTFDITDAVKTPGPQELIVAAWDPTDAGNQPRGKQVHNPEGIWYTPTTGIWQTVWLEPVPEAHVGQLQLSTDVDRGRLVIKLISDPLISNARFRVIIMDSGKEVASADGEGSAAVEIPAVKSWTPDSPFLYDLKVTYGQDAVSSYIGFRKINLGADEHGVTRLVLNNKPLFMYGPLDQGFWPDGLYTAPTDEALRYDIEVLKKLGCNVARKHVKVEPDRWYYWCDKLGLLVWQDMPSGDKIDSPKDYQRAPESAAQFELELKNVIDAFCNHPCIVMWVPFNEGWGQYDTARVVDLVRKWDPTRLVDSASGWHETGAGDVHDIHDYPGPSSPKTEPKRAAVLGEFGGLGLPLPGHTWQAEKNWGYKSFPSREELTDAYLKLIDALRPLIADPGLSAAIYTQTTDVEIECNGLMTYDRAIIKPDAEKVAGANRRLYGPPPTVTTVVPTSQERGFLWRYTVTRPADDWAAPDFADSAWQEGPAGFGREGTPGITVRTPWDSSDIWIRRRIDLAAPPAQPHLQLYHDEDCEVYINGKPVASAKGYTTRYALVPIADKSVLRAGTNVIAIHCHQTVGGQGVDAGLVDVVETVANR